MPDFIITLTAAQAQRVAAAFAYLNGGSPATAEQVKAWLKERVKEVVYARELETARKTVDTTAKDTLRSEGW